LLQTFLLQTFPSSSSVGRIVYFHGYTAAAEKRRPGFAIQATAASALLIGALGRVIYLIAINGVQ